MNLGFVGKNPGIWRFLVRFYGDSTPVVSFFGDLGENPRISRFFFWDFFLGTILRFLDDLSRKFGENEPRIFHHWYRHST